MNQSLSIFDFEDQPIRILDQQGEPWFVAADVCRVLGLDQVTNAIRTLDEDEKITLSNDKGNPRAGVPHQYNLISESGLYALVFKSRKPEAVRFRKWVTAEVLPALRRDGRYQMPGTEDALPIAVDSHRVMEAMVDRLAGRMTELFTDVMETVRDLHARVGAMESGDKVIPIEHGRRLPVESPDITGTVAGVGQLVVFRDPREEQMRQLLDVVLTGSRGPIRQMSALELLSVAGREGLFPHVIPEDFDIEDKGLQARWGCFLRKHLDGKCYTLSDSQRWLVERVKPKRTSFYEFLNLSA